MKIKETYVYENIVPFNVFGTNDSTPQDTIKTVLYLINGFDFMIKEDLNKIILSINTKNKAIIELLLYNSEKETKKEEKYKENINNLQNRIKDLLIIIGKQEQRMNELKKNEENHKILINKLEQITTTISKKLDSYEINKKYNIYNNNNKNNINLNYNRTMSFSGNISNKNNLYNKINNNNTNIKTNYNSPFNPYLPGNSNSNNLLTLPQNKPPSQAPNFDKRQAINFDIKNYKK